MRERKTGKRTGAGEIYVHMHVCAATEDSCVSSPTACRSHVPQPNPLPTPPFLLIACRFFAKYLKSDFGKTPDENLRVASDRFYGLLKKVEAAGEREEYVILPSKECVCVCERVRERK